MSQTLEEPIYYLRKYITPPPEIIQAVDDLFALYQFTNQYGVDSYAKWKGKNWFKGSLAEWIASDDMKEVVELSDNKPWQTLIRSIYLLNNVEGSFSRGYLTNHSLWVPMNNFHKLDKDTQVKVMEIISKGTAAYETIKKWLSPINKKDVLDAIYDAVKVKVGTDRYDQFQLLRMGMVKTSAPGPVLFDYILEIDNPEALVEYLETISPAPPESIILTFIRNPEKGWKPNIYLFYIWKNTIYILDSGDRRLNVNNTAGNRNPGRYLAAKFEHVWLPFDILLTEKKASKSNAMTLRNQKVFNRGSLTKIFDKEPALGAWLNMFMYNVADAITTLSEKKALPEGVSTATVLKVLEDKRGPIEIKERVKMNREDASFESSNDASSYLVKKYGKQVSAIVPVLKQLPTVLGDRKYVEGVVAFEQRKLVAKSLEDLLWQDWTENHERVYKWLADFFQSDIPKLLKMAIASKGKQFPVKIHPDFGGVYIGGKHFDSDSMVPEKGAILKPTIVKTPVLDISWSPHVYNLGTKWNKDELEFIATKDGKLYDFIPIPLCRHPFVSEKNGEQLFCTRPLGHKISWSSGHWSRKIDVELDAHGNGPSDQVHSMCAICGKFRWKVMVALLFNDWLQFAAFFDLKQGQLPREMIDHFHWQNEAYTGNDILDDVDPVDLIKDPWFRQVRTVEHISLSQGDRELPHPEIDSDDKPHVNVNIPLCQYCFKKAGGKIKPLPHFHIRKKDPDSLDERTFLACTCPECKHESARECKHECRCC